MIAPLLALLLLAAPPPPPTAPLDVAAERMELDQATGKIVFEGDVRATQGDVTLRCARLTARLVGEGLADVQAESVTLTTGDWTATAGAARYDDAAGTVALTGSPTVRRGPDVLEGARIVVWPETGRMVVERPRGTVRAPRLDGLRKALPR
jgi:lipopolysaccharide export system protein LptA